jgi:hypothetical protein
MPYSVRTTRSGHEQPGHYAPQKHVRRRVLEDQGFRPEWITAAYVAELVIDLAHNCPAPVLVIDGWQIVLGLLQQASPDALCSVLHALVYRALPVAVVVVLGPGPGGYGDVAGVERVMEMEGRRRVVTLVGDVGQQDVDQQRE